MYSFQTRDLLINGYTLEPWGVCLRPYKRVIANVNITLTFLWRTAGSAGSKGDPGTPGKDGTDGRDGKQGPQGLQGQKGEQGFQGPPGQDGRNGTDGVAGVQGPQGLKGEPGREGQKGDVGPVGPKGQIGPKWANFTLYLCLAGSPILVEISDCTVHTRPRSVWSGSVCKGPVRRIFMGKLDEFQKVRLSEQLTVFYCVSLKIECNPVK